MFCNIDDADIIFMLKYFVQHSADNVLKMMCEALIYRKLFHVEFNTQEYIQQKIEQLKEIYSDDEFQYLVSTGSTSNNMYSTAKDNIYIKFKDNKLVDIASITEQWNIDALANPMVKHYIIYPK
ncbi:MAG: hypothetical protein IPK18_04025 [Sphingobacteriales bacterium]|nr:MAG: hypothetical protein IPK18_04025 [Sphingobacteriales bacterium]